MKSDFFMKEGIVEAIAKTLQIDLIVQYGNINSNSKDIDLLVVSNDFEGISILKRRDLLKKIDCRIDAVCLTNNQLQRFKESKCSLFESIKRNHLKLYGNKTTVL